MKNIIGNSPLLEILYKYKGEERKIYAKIEFFNLTGSIKDRMALHIIEQSYLDGSLKKGMPIVEATSGNTGISFSALGAMYGHPVHIFMPSWMSRERKDLIRTLLLALKVKLPTSSIKSDFTFDFIISRAWVGRK